MAKGKYEYCISGRKRSEIENGYIRDYGTKHKQPTENINTYRTDYRRYRDRILYMGGFRRLQGKTQVLSTEKSGDHRTRLTHTLEVEQIAVSMADALGLNKDLVSAIALGHDIGHTPFGHAVERYLNEELKDQGGFSHAIQSVKYIMANLEKGGHDMPNEILSGILQHDSDLFNDEKIENYKEQFDCTKIKELGNEMKYEGQVVFWADKIAYATHDFEDFYRSKIYTKANERKKIEKEILEIIQKISVVGVGYPKIETLSDIKTSQITHGLMDNIIKNSFNNINKENSNVANDETIKTKDEYMNGLKINFDESYLKKYKHLRSFLDDNFIKSPEVQCSDAKAEKIVKSIFNDYLNNHKMLPLEQVGNIDKQIKEYGGDCEKCKKKIKKRVIADYISTMTENYIKEIYNNLNFI